MSNEAFAKAKSWESRFYRKARRDASKKRRPYWAVPFGVDRLLRKMPVRLEPMAETIAEGANIGRQNRVFFANALSHLRQGYGGQGTTHSTN